MKSSLLGGALAAFLLVSPAGSHAAPAPRDVEAALRSIVEKSELSSARSGVYAVSLDTGKVVFEKDPDVLLNPASNVKLFTSAAALARLGPEYRFETEFYVEAGGRPGAPRALHVRGKGDPTLVTERLWAIAGELAHLGIGRVGDIVVDEGFFDGDRQGPGFDQEHGDRSYLAPTGALSLNFNSVAIHVAPGAAKGARGRVEVEPPSAFFEVENRVVTAGPRAARRVVPSSEARNGRQRIVVTGRLPLGGRAQVVWRKIDDPPAYFGHTLRQLLELRGVKVSGRIRTGPVPPDARLAYVADSEPLAEVVRRLNKTSNNFTAEQILKTLGAEAKGAPGSFRKGVEAVEEFLAGVGVPRGSFVMKNGSGLNDTNRFSARQTVQLLRAMREKPGLWPEFLSSLPVAGRDGTIRWRMEGTEAAGRVRAKTGTLEGVTGLSGYAQTASGETVAFAILVNDYAGRAARVVRAVDALAAALAASGGAPSELSAAVAMASGPAAAPASTSAQAPDLRAAVRTYYDLGRAGDHRNVAFLRSALRTETDPALRMAIAECVYLSDPESESARRALLDAIEPSALGRLVAAAAEPDAPAPVLGSLADLGAEGSLEALARLLEVAPAAVEEPLADVYADVLAEVAGADPDDVVTALFSSPTATADAVVSALSLGIARSGETPHPFVAALSAAATKEGDVAAFARTLAERMRQAEAAARAPRMGPAPTVVPAAGSAAPGASTVVPASSTAVETRPGG